MMTIGACVSKGLSQMILEFEAVEQPGQTIMAGIVCHAACHAMQLGDVVTYQHCSSDVAFVITNGRGGIPDDGLLAIGSQ